MSKRSRILPIIIGISHKASASSYYSFLWLVGEVSLEAKQRKNNVRFGLILECHLELTQREQLDFLNHLRDFSQIQAK